jgi:threonine dehydrogenase-like Zn-dependent dehydrogenase
MHLGNPKKSHERGSFLVAAKARTGAVGMRQPTPAFESFLAFCYYVLMKTAVFRGTGKVELEERPYPKVQNPSDVVVRVTLACVCGSDLWYYRGVNERKIGSAVGHEFMGVVEEVGSAVKRVKKGDLVIAPFRISDGTCVHCKAGFTPSCVNAGTWGIDTDGGQGEAVRVPLADGTLVKVPGKNHSPEILASLLTLSDVMSTGHHAAISAGVKKGDTVAVVGDGAVGLCAIIAAKRLGATRIVALSRNPTRQKLAKEFGATDILKERGDAAIKAVMKLTDNTGVDAALECVGTDESIATCAGIARPGGMIGTVGLPTYKKFAYKDLFWKNVGIRGGVAPARVYIPELMDDVLKMRINPGLVFDFQTNLDGLKEAYAAMDERRAIKSMLIVSNI